MRETIIGVFAVVVLIVTVLSFMLMRLTVGDVSNKGESSRAVTAAVAQLQVEGLRIERWLGEQAMIEEMREPFKITANEARGNEATTRCNGLEERSRSSSAFVSVRPTLIVLFDDKGLVLGRNGTALMRGESFAERHADMMETILAGRTGSSVWIDKNRGEQLLASYAPIRDGGKVIGGIVVGTAFNDERLQAASDATSEIGLFAAVKVGGATEVVARSAKIDDTMLEGQSGAEQAFATDQVIGPLTGLDERYDSAAKALGGYGDGKQAVIAAVTETKQVGTLGKLWLPLLGVFVLGLLLTAMAGHLINNYIAQPIADLEDGLLAVLNGQTDLRFELEHKVLGGLVFRVNSLLNQLLGVREDDTDAEGRPSVAPSSSSFSAALNVDERMVSLSLADVEDGRKLRDEPPEDYYKRVYDEYLAAKRSIGDPVDHIKFAPFNQRIKSSEQELTNRHGKPFRYKVELQGKEVVLVAVPLA
jgi:hypothetical protein